MKVKALISFSGPSVSMARGTTAEITDEVILQDLLRAGYVEAAETAKTEKEVPKSEGKRSYKKRGS